MLFQEKSGIWTWLTAFVPTTCCRGAGLGSHFQIRAPGKTRACSPSIPLLHTFSISLRTTFSIPNINQLFVLCVWHPPSTFLTCKMLLLDTRQAGYFSAGTLCSAWSTSTSPSFLLMQLKYFKWQSPSLMLDRDSQTACKLQFIVVLWVLFISKIISACNFLCCF